MTFFKIIQMENIFVFRFFATNCKTLVLKKTHSIYGWLQKKRELSEKGLSDFIKFLYFETAF
jgi:hypothetical protein